VARVERLGAALSVGSLFVAALGSWCGDTGELEGVRPCSWSTQALNCWDDYRNIKGHNVDSPSKEAVA
jgi:hypothetical protein